MDLLSISKFYAKYVSAILVVLILFIVSSSLVLPLTTKTLEVMVMTVALFACAFILTFVIYMVTTE